VILIGKGKIKPEAQKVNKRASLTIVQIRQIALVLDLSLWKICGFREKMVVLGI